jgi:signal transduction histidine kinase
MTDTKEKPDLVKQMSSVVSHEIRNPLAIISNSLYFIKTKLGAGGAALDPKIAKHLGVIESEVKHSNEIIEEMLSYTRKRELQQVPLSLAGIMDEQARAYAVPANVTLKTVDDPSNPHVNVDKDAVCYALRCVLSNAVLAMPEGGAVTVTCTHDDKMGYITVADSGPGFAGGDAEKPFEPFYTTRPRGMGLGLPIARKFMEAHGGTVTAANAPGGGAKVTLSLPLIK